MGWHVTLYFCFFPIKLNGLRKAKKSTKQGKSHLIPAILKDNSQKFHLPNPVRYSLYFHFILKIILYLKILISVLRKIPAHLSRHSFGIPAAFPFVDCLVSQYFSTQVTSPTHNYFCIRNLLPPWPSTYLGRTLRYPDRGTSRGSVAHGEPEVSSWGPAQTTGAGGIYSTTVTSAFNLERALLSLEHPSSSAKTDSLQRFFSWREVFSIIILLLLILLQKSSHTEWIFCCKL